MTPDEKLEKALNELAKREDAYGDAELAFADAAYNYEVAYAEAVLRAEGTVKEKEALATIGAKEALNAKLQAQATRDFMKVKVKDAQDAVSARQSLLASALRTNSRF